MAFNLKNLEIKSESFGKTFLLVGQSPYYEYVDGKKTDKMLGQGFDVAVVEQGLEKLRVKIPDPGLEVDLGENSMIPVKFEGLKIGFYQDFRHDNQIVLKATATGIHPVSGGADRAK